MNAQLKDSMMGRQERKRGIAMLMLSLLLVIPVFAHADTGDVLRFGGASITVSKLDASVRTVTIPLGIENSTDLTAIDIPLKFGERGEGIDLIAVDFESGCAHYFDVKEAQIDNENKTVILGLLSMAFNPGQPDLAAGDGDLATLTFEITDPGIETIILESTSFSSPRRELSFMWTEIDADGMFRVHEMSPEFGPTSINIAATTADVPSEWELSQNYPNPCNASTRINFALPIDSDVRLDIYNVLGQKVATLVDELLPAGRHSVDWNDNTMASGMYFYRLQTENFTETRKMVLLK